MATHWRPRYGFIPQLLKIGGGLFGLALLLNLGWLGEERGRDGAIPAGPWASGSECGSEAAFVAAAEPPAGLSGQLTRGFSTNQAEPVGLALFYRTTTDLVYRQAASWDDAGALGPMARMADGSLFVAPVPSLLALNTGPASNQLWRLDPHDGELRPFVELPRGQAAAAHPFGITALSNDCLHTRLLAATVVDSDRLNERGLLVAVGPEGGRLTTLVQGFDALGLSILTSSEGEYLLAGSARDDRLYAFRLDNKGHVVQAGKVWLSLSELGITTDPHMRIKQIEIVGAQSLQLTLVRFNYTAMPQSDSGQIVVRLIRTADGWQRLM